MTEKRYTYRYYLPDHGQSLEDCYEVSSVFDEDCPEFIAEDAAENYHDAHDGWECSWPMNIVVLIDDQPLHFSVDREAVPQFRARKVNAASTTMQQKGK